MTGVETLNEARGKLCRLAGQLNARNARGRSLPPIILMTDDTRAVDWLGAVRALPSGSAIVVRHRDARLREVLARQLRPVCAARRIKLLIADDPALAQRERADGVHVPQRRIAILAAQKALHPRWLVTASAHDEASARMACRSGADAILIAPVFPTASHRGSRTLGVVRFAAIAGRVRAAVYALGGVNAETVQRLTASRINGVALIGGWTNI